MSEKKFLTNNSSTSPLARNQIFIGRSDNTINYTKIKFNYISDAPSEENGILIQFSEDNLVWNTAYQFTAKLNTTTMLYTSTEEIFVKGKMFRLVYRNGNLPQTFFRLNTFFYLTEEIMEVETGDSVPAISVKNTNDFLLDVISGQSTTSSDFQYLSLFGHSNKIEVLLPSTNAEYLRVKSGGNRDDIVDGDGARKIRIDGLDSNWNPISEELELNGRDASNPTTKKFLRVNMVEVIEVGTEYGTNSDDIVIENLESEKVVGLIEKEESISHHLIYSIPEGKKAIIKDIFIHSITKVNLRIYLIEHKNNGQEPIKKLIKKVIDANDESKIVDSYETMIPEKTDLIVDSSGGKKNLQECACQIKMLIL